MRQIAALLAWGNQHFRHDPHAIQESLDGKNVEWLEPVTDAQYEASL